MLKNLLTALAIFNMVPWALGAQDPGMIQEENLPLPLKNCLTSLDPKQPDLCLFEIAKGAPAGQKFLQVVSSSERGIISCAINTLGEVYCWGAFTDWGLGVDNPAAGVLLMKLPAPAITLTASHSNFCALLADATVWCWGNNETALLGYNNTSKKNLGTAVPVKIKLRGSIAQVYIRWPFAYAVTQKGTIFVWGTGPKDAPINKAGTPTRFTTQIPKIKQLAGDIYNGLYVLDSLGRLFIVPNSDSRKRVRLVKTATPLKTLQSRGISTCALTITDEVYCWGIGLFQRTGQKGGGSALGKTGHWDKTSIPTLVPLPEKATEIAVGHMSACARTDSYIYCWGTHHLLPGGYRKTPTRIR